MTDREPAPDDVVIVGQAARLPGVDSLDAWWDGLCAGTEFHHSSTDAELLEAGLPEALLNDSNLVRRRPVIDDAEWFDPRFFGFTPREAAACDPQQRLFLEVCWELFEQSGHDPRKAGPTCGVFAGAGPTTYLPAADTAYEPVAHFDAVVANERDFIAPRVAYKLGLQGPAISIVSGCATSLVAIHLAVQSLQSHETDMAVAGGATVFFPQHAGYLYHPHGITSPDGRCRPFSQSAHGTVHGDAVGAVLLRRRADAEADGDAILGVILGTAVTNDGSNKMGFTAPSVEGQVRAISEAIAVAGVPASSISYVETHGTATKIGDAIEVQALNRALADAPTGSCRLGALKPNIGHTDTAAGATALIKVLHAFDREQLPPIAGFDGPNPSIDVTGPCRINTDLTPWPRSTQPRRAGVSSFSIGGTNAHIIVEEPPARATPRSGSQSTTLRFAAPTDAGLQESVTRFADWLDRRNASGLSTPTPSEAAFTLAERDQHHPRRLLIPVDAGEDLATACREALQSGPVDGSSRPTIFVFSGQGSQYPAMARDLLHTSETFATAMRRCQEVFHRHDLDVLDLLANGSDSDDEQRRLLNQTELTQPAIFAVEVALASMLAEWGLRPDVVVGHSVGEFAAAVVAGCIDLAEAADAVAIRGRLVASTSFGAMAAVAAPVRAVEEARLPVEVAATNGPRQTVITGSVENVTSAIETLNGRGIRARRLASERAFHSQLLEPITAELTERLSAYTWRRPSIPMVWAANGTWLEETPTPQMWAEQVRQAVRFDLAVATGHTRFPNARWVEVGPGHVLADLVSMNVPDATTAALIGPGYDNHARALADRAWAHGLTDTHLVPTTYRVPMPGLVLQRRLLTSRARMPEPVQQMPEPVQQQTPEPLAGDPATVVTQVWAEEFGIDDLAENADFFVDGGDSVIAARIAARINQSFPVDVGPGHVMQEPCTPQGLIERLTALIADRVASLSDDEVTALLDTN